MHRGRWSAQFLSFPLLCNWNMLRICLIIMIEQRTMAVANPKCAYFLKHSTFMNTKDDKQEKYQFSHPLLPPWCSQNHTIGVGRDLFNISIFFFFCWYVVLELICSPLTFREFEFWKTRCPGSCHRVLHHCWISGLASAIAKLGSLWLMDEDTNHLQAGGGPRGTS